MTKKHLKALLWVILFISLAIWLSLIYQLQQVDQAYHRHLFSFYLPAAMAERQDLLIHMHLSQNATSTPPRLTAGSIQAWMTFGYLDTVFKLDPSMLQSSLSITDSHYPNVSIIHIAKETGTSSASLIQKIETTLAGNQKM